MRKSQLIAAVPVAAVTAIVPAGAAFAQPGPPPQHAASHVLLDSGLGPQMALRAHGRLVTVARFSQRDRTEDFTVIRDRGGQIEFRSGRFYVVTRRFGSSLGRRGSHFITGRPARDGYYTIQVVSHGGQFNVLTASHGQVTASPLHRGAAGQEWRITR